jgi:hypothetical protein
MYLRTCAIALSGIPSGMHPYGMPTITGIFSFLPSDSFLRNEQPSSKLRITNYELRITNYELRRNNLSSQRENLSAQRENLSAQRENLSAQRENLSAQRENLFRQRENLFTQRENFVPHVCHRPSLHPATFLPLPRQKSKNR